MEIILIVLVLLLLIIVIFQRIKEKHRNQEITYLINKLDSILSERSREQVKIVTSDEQIKRLMEAVNDVLTENSQNLACYLKSQESMKKMLSNISHDLKTPLTVVLGYLEMENLKNRSKQLDVVYQKVKEVIDMMNEFFDLAKLEARDKHYPMEQVNIAELCRVCVINFYGELEKEHAKVELDIPEQNLYIESNGEAITRILNNLISNAIKYGMDGRYLKVIVKDDEENVYIQVIDHGKGIPAKHQDEVFDRLYTLEDSRSSEYRGSGLGLSITKELVTILHGKIELTSTPYEVTKFTIQLQKTNNNQLKK